VKRKTATIVKPIIKKKPRRVVHARGSRRSARLALTRDDNEEESTDNEAMDVSS
jgi:hypothetical protein